MKKLLINGQRLLLPIISILQLTACSLPEVNTNSVNQSVNIPLPLISYVDPFIGTAGKGKTYPGATLPYGMVQLSPDNGRNGWDWISGYFYPDNVISGFSHTHLSGTGAGDLYDISFMPLAGTVKQKTLDEVNKSPTIYSSFSHDNETTSPGYYQVYLTDYDINVELTAGLRTGVQKYTYDEKHNNGQVKLDLNYARNWDATVATKLTIIDKKTIAGYRKSTGWAKDQRVYFYTTFSQAITATSVNVTDQVITSNSNNYETVGSKGLTANFTFDLSTNKEVLIKTAISSVSIENAKQNLAADEAKLAMKRSFNQYLQYAENSWEKTLSNVKIKASKDNMTQFYTALYHSNLAPRVFSDSNGQYKGPDGNIHRAENYQRYSFFSLWDTFRALHPWKTITDVEHSKDMMKSLMAHYDEYGLLPVWNFQGNETDMMMGYHAVPVLVDAYLKGIIENTPTNGEYLLTAAKKSAMQDPFAIKEYRELGYVPFETISWNVSRTLEYAFDDWSIAQLAKELNQKQDYSIFSQRANNYKNHFDSNSNFMRAKDSQGKFKPKFDPLAYHPEDYCEANAWQYNFFVPHDIEGLIALMGGTENFTNKLDEMFTTEQSSDKLPEWISGFIGQYVHGNEPAHHVPYLYQYVNQPHKTQQRVRQIMNELYTTEPDGLAGNEDAGQMSAWYMFSALGFYPVNPVSGEYVLGSPEVNFAELTLPNNKVFTILVENQSEKNIYVESVNLNGKPYFDYTLSHDDIMAGGTLKFTMSSEAK
jgi:predicted alpha-1,2-mannosidase